MNNCECTYEGATVSVVLHLGKQ